VRAASSIETGDRQDPTLQHGLRFDYRLLAVLTVIAVYGLIVLGGTVRATGSGTACPDWPLCHGRVVPPFETKVMIEYAHRLVASAVGFMILGTVIWVGAGTARTDSSHAAALR
jgi:heme A synthase